MRGAQREGHLEGSRAKENPAEAGFRYQSILIPSYGVAPILPKKSSTISM